MQSAKEGPNFYNSKIDRVPHGPHLFSLAVVDAPYPILFVERSVSGYALPMEYAICRCWLGTHEEAIRVNDLINATRAIPFRAPCSRRLRKAVLSAQARGAIQ